MTTTLNTMPQHTAWRVEDRHGCYAIIDDKGQEVVFIDNAPRHHNGVPCGSITSQGRTEDELKAIVGVIAASPKMLAALRVIAAWEPSAAPDEPGGMSIMDAIDIAKAAIPDGI